MIPNIKSLTLIICLWGLSRSLPIQEDSFGFGNDDDDDDDDDDDEDDEDGGDDDGADRTFIMFARLDSNNVTEMSTKH